MCKEENEKISKLRVMSENFISFEFKYIYKN